MLEDNKRPCFVVAPIGDEGSDTRKRSDLVLKIIKRAVKDCGYEAIRSDEIAEPGMIGRQMIRHLAEDPLVVADLSGANPNVYYELAIRHAVGKPVIQLIERGQKVPFDVGDMRTVSIDLSDMYDTEERIRNSVKEAIKPEHVVTTPISAALGPVVLSKRGA